MIYLKYFVGNQKLVRISHGKRAIGVRATEIRLYILSAEVVESIWQIHRVTNDDLTYAIEIQEKKINDVFFTYSRYTYLHRKTETGVCIFMSCLIFKASMSELRPNMSEI